MTTLKEMLDKTVSYRSDAIALRYKREGSWETITYDAFLESVRNTAEFLVSEFQISPGDHVAIYLENSPEWAIIYFAIVGLGAVAIPIDVKLREQEIAHILRDSQTTLLFGECEELHAYRRYRITHTVIESHRTRQWQHHPLQFSQP